MTNNELLRRVNNLISVGTVCEIVPNKRLARVEIMGRITSALPIVSGANSFKRFASPVRVGEQVLVLSPQGDSDFGFILAGIFNSDCKEPDGFSEDVEVTEFEDGTVISYDTKAKELKVDAIKTITIICKDATVKANSVKVDSSSIDMGLGGKGVVTGECVCAFTGLPHHDMSANTRSKK